MLGTKVGLVRSGVFNFDSNGNGIGPFPADPLDRVDAFAPPGGVLAGDIPVTGDWIGLGHASAGWYRSGTWYLDANNNGTWDGTAGGDLLYTGFGGPNDTPVVGDWTGIGKATIGVVTGGGATGTNFLWVLDTFGNGQFVQPTPVCTPLTPPLLAPQYPNCGTDTVSFTGSAVFAFGGAKGDVPVVGNWFKVVSSTGFAITQVGMVRTYQGSGSPFLWLLDSGIAGTSTNLTPLANQGNWSAGIAYNANDVVLFNGSSYISQCPTVSTPFGTACPQTAYNLNHTPSAGLPWMLITQLPNSTHQFGNCVGANCGTAFGGIPGDIPVVGDWYNTGVVQFGDFRQNFLWVLDVAPPLAPQGSHLPGFVFPYGGLFVGGVLVDKPIVGKW
jgi:hypothetical protein